MHIPIETFTLPNGLTVILSEDHTAPLVAVNLWYHVGSANERPGRTGFAHLFEHMLFQGSANVGANEHFELVQRAGGTLNGSTWLDRTNYFETVPSNQLELALWLEANRMGWLLPAMTQQKLDTQRDVVQNERRWSMDNQPYGTWWERLPALAFPIDHPFHHVRRFGSACASVRAHRAGVGEHAANRYVDVLEVVHGLRHRPSDERHHATKAGVRSPVLSGCQSVGQKFAVTSSAQFSEEHLTAAMIQPDH